MNTKKSCQLSLAVLLSFAFFSGGCAGMPKVPHAENPLTVGPLARILVYVGNVPLGESGAGAEGTTLNIGGMVYFSAQGRDMNNKPIAIAPKWTASKPEIVEINPSVGPIVAVKGLREGSVEIVVEQLGVKKVVSYITIAR